MDFATVRENAERGYGRVLTMAQRGMRIGMLRRQIRSAAHQIGLSIELRVARIALANAVFEMAIVSFTQLSDDGLIALVTWACANQQGVSAWLSEKYGGTERLPGI